MAVKITIGNPYRWRRWTNDGATMIEHGRPSPGSWFFEARYHHSGTWKIGLDFRPTNGKMPELWHPPFIWRPAHEIAAAEKQLETLGGIADLMNMSHDFGKLSELGIQLNEYSKSAKTQKKLLFGSAEGAGAHQHVIKTAFKDVPIVESPLIPAGQMIAVDPAAITYGLDLGKGMSSSAQLLKKHTSHHLPTSVEEEFSTALTGWTVQGAPLPYDPELYFEKFFKWYVRVTLMGMMPNPVKAQWDCNLDFSIGINDQLFSTSLTVKVDTFLLTGSEPPVIQVVAVRVMAMDQKELRLELELKYAKIGGEILEIIFEDSAANQGMFPINGWVAPGYTVWNQKLLP